ncbi:DUF5690 family protein [Mariniblastus fucicola]|uniref:Major Facilitator Superfamily protein n=1 Tax=Mariniblastus fucicola TaxID=980251 RepID=A0A5B9PFQ5_9BACT|nr:DUF5690 family protein [Mariniblastus fucicola]QEG24030.1 hypothetical protein MFFC18_39410 [Mariniblastus fucicola]
MLRQLDLKHNVKIVLWASAAAFVAYFSMYGFRKPFLVAKFDGQSFLGSEVELKTALAISQILGYANSKYIGVRLCSGMDRKWIAAWLCGLILCAQLSLLAFAVAPPQWKVAAIFFNGLPLGMIWGFVVRYLEGRRTSDIALSFLCFSFLIASGVVKDVGLWLMNSRSVSESWMPFETGCIFLVPFFIAVFALSKLPPATQLDIEQRQPRKGMTTEQRWSFLRTFATGLVPLFIVYCLLTAFRDYRDNYGIEMLTELGYAGTAAVFSKIEFPIAVSILVVLGLLFLVKDNRRSLQLIFTMMVSGSIILGATNLLFVSGYISGFLWMVGIGLGAYLIYVPYNAVLFERMIAVTGTASTAVFAIYIADALGYTGSVAIQLYKDLLAGEASRIGFFIGFTWLLSILAFAMLVFSGVYFSRLSQQNTAGAEDA